jgi:hypothetical protein
MGVSDIYITSGLNLTLDLGLDEMEMVVGNLARASIQAS